MTTPETTDALAHREPQTLATRHEFSVEEIIAQANKVLDVMKRAMKDGVHYGTIPGTPKPTLYKAGAEKLCMMFRFDPQYQSTETYEGEHLTVKSICTLYHIPTGLRMGSGEGSCSTRESKYAWRKEQRKCPSCGAEAIIKGKPEFGGGWICWKKRDGCGAKFDSGDPRIASQVVERVPNPDLADQYNTVLKMANKRSRTDAVLACTAASDVFTQDIGEDDDDHDDDDEKPGEERREPERPQTNGGTTGAVISEPQDRRLWAIATQHGWEKPQVKTLIADWSHDHTTQILRSEYEVIINKLKAGPKK